VRSVRPKNHIDLPLADNRFRLRHHFLAGVEVDKWPIPPERKMDKAQHQDKAWQSWGEFFDEGSKLSSAGVNMHKNPMNPFEDNVQPSDEKLRKEGVRTDTWGLDEKKNDHKPKLPGVKI